MQLFYKYTVLSSKTFHLVTLYLISML